MRYIILKTEEIEALDQFHKNSTDNNVRKHSQCLLLSHHGRTIIDLANIFDFSRKTIERWFDSWAKCGMLEMTFNSDRFIYFMDNTVAQIVKKICCDTL